MIADATSTPLRAFVDKLRRVEVQRDALEPVTADSVVLTIDGGVSDALFFLGGEGLAAKEAPRVRRSSFALLQHLVNRGRERKDSLHSATLHEALYSPALVEMLRGHKPSPLAHSKSTLLVSFDGGASFCQFPTDDCAVARLNGTLYICTTLSDGEKCIMHVQNASERLDSVLRGFTCEPPRALHTLPAASDARRCLNCQCTSTPMWRRGPDGIASLCNACGVKWRSGKLVMEGIECTKRAKHAQRTEST